MQEEEEAMLPVSTSLLQPSNPYDPDTKWKTHHVKNYTFNPSAFWSQLIWPLVHRGPKTLRVKLPGVEKDCWEEENMGKIYDTCSCGLHDPAFSLLIELVKIHTMCNPKLSSPGGYVCICYNLLPALGFYSQQNIPWNSCWHALCQLYSPGIVCLCCVGATTWILFVS